MNNILVLHGTDANSKSNWFPWLQSKLKERGHRVWVPDLPRADKPNIERYNNYIISNKDWDFNEGSIIIGHSSGAVAILGLLQALPEDTKVDTCILVGSFKDGLGWDSLDSLFEEPFDFEIIKARSKRFIFIHSDNDPYCPLEHAEYLSGKLDGELIIKEGEGHFTLGKDPKYDKFPFILEVLDETL